MNPLGIHHVAVAVTDLDEAVDFYTRVLGMRLRHDRPGSIGVGAWLDVGAQQLHLIETTPAPAPGPHFAVEVSDLDATLGKLRAAGATVTDPVPIGTARQAFLTDPSGNAIELHEPAT
jgi:catechol 2,3-dioxygenase-like lactoylglutathione lyase family enzyme